MHVIFMDESGGDKPIVLTVSMYWVRVHHEPRQQFGLVEGIKTYGYSNADQNNGYAHMKRVKNRFGTMLDN